ncbi:hypothetical protein B0H11DRAFT_2201850 [Mycena galericulata]|nr:hypothetical protein B0H11DRAFT_2201850 [Mycena galericulata]
MFISLPTAEVPYPAVSPPARLCDPEPAANRVHVHKATESTAAQPSPDMRAEYRPMIKYGPRGATMLTIPQISLDGKGGVFVQVDFGALAVTTICYVRLRVHRSSQRLRGAWVLTPTTFVVSSDSGRVSGSTPPEDLGYASDKFRTLPRSLSSGGISPDAIIPRNIICYKGEQESSLSTVLAPLLYERSNTLGRQLRDQRSKEDEGGTAPKLWREIHIKASPTVLKN